MRHQQTHGIGDIAIVLLDENIQAQRSQRSSVIKQVRTVTGIPTHA